jgi:hypothetical protein
MPLTLDCHCHSHCAAAADDDVGAQCHLLSRILEYDDRMKKKHDQAVDKWPCILVDYSNRKKKEKKTTVVVIGMFFTPCPCCRPCPLR